MTTNDKPVCYQCQVLLGRGMEGPWLSYDTAAERDARVAEHLREGRACYMRDLYARPQPAAPQVPEGWVITAVGRDVRVASPVEGPGSKLVCHDGTLSERLLHALASALIATPPAPEQPKPEPYRWLVGNEAYLSEAEAVEAIMQWGPSNATATPVYRDPLCSHAEAEQPKPDDDRAAAEYVYSTTAFNYEANPVGSRDWCLFWNGWKARAEQPKPAETREQRRASALTFSDTNPEVGFIADGERLNCPACGGSGHVDDVQPKPAGDVEAVASSVIEEMLHLPWQEVEPVAREIARRLAAQPAQGEGEK